jgi:hypothetical protein
MTQPPETLKLNKAESARINGAKSTGATSPEGKLRAANGNLKHGAYSSRVIMDGEDPELYNVLRSYTLDIFKPQDAVEAEIVDVLINTRWRLRRMEAAETDSLNAAVLLNKPYVEARFESIDVAHERALAIQSDSAHIERNTRVEERLHRIYEKNLQMLNNYRRKAGRSTTTIATESLQPDKPQPCPAPPAEAPVLTDPPNSPPASRTPAASIITGIAVFLVILASLLMIPASTAAQKINTFTSPPAVSSLTSVHPVIGEPK